MYVLGWRATGTEKDGRVIRYVVMDMDGVLYRGKQPVAGACETIQALQQHGVQVAFLTNNASMHRAELVQKLSDLGVPCTMEQMWGSAYTTARYLAHEAPEARVLLVGTAGMAREMEEAGLRVVTTHHEATHVVAGLDRDLTYAKLTQAHYAICNGAAFIATNLDAMYPDSSTTTAPGGGAIVSVLRTSTSVEPLVIGKPQVTGMALIAESWGVGPDAMAAVGDRLDTDIAAAKAFGCRAALVLTGVTTRAEAQQATGVQKPDTILGDLTELIPFLQQ
jgi:4-nitrophenyl phosphatase